MIKKLKQADFLRNDCTVRILMYYDDKLNKIILEKDILSEIDTYTDKYFEFESDKKYKADILYKRMCLNLINKCSISPA